MPLFRPKPLLKMATSTGGKILEGVFGINKPIGISSAQVIRDCQNFFDPSARFAPALEQVREQRDKESKYQRNRRRRFPNKVQTKIGHGGTLDPLAGGVLILGVGKGTKSLQQFLLCTKTYETVVVFGASTDTYDRLGKIIKKGDYSNVTRDAVEKALEPFRGKYRQMPPLYSSLKMNGKPLYEYAREGKPIPREIETREVEVSELELVEWYEPGTHKHYWPDEEAGQAEKDVAQSVWRVAKAQEDGGEESAAKMAAEEESKALEEFNSKKRAAEEAVDGLVSDETRASKRAKNEEGNPEDTLMSGALEVKKEKLTQPPKGRGSDLVPVRPDDMPAPWEGKGPPAAKIRMTVTSGFYVRSLCHDLGEKLGCGAMMAELVRTRQGQFTLGGANCLEYDDLLRGEEVWGPQVESMLDKWNARPGEIQEPTVENGGIKVESEAVPAREEELVAASG
ncbi:Putative tRNA pseudouridine synthase 4 [Podospora comata]|uniref:tRNA pseudouridine(55) synthase n=1 Tax=Podospora comata TaxID=48703 RepID=A0ABY6S3P3_PODCO|nr:Putative tRNA pseudouridine synthase 4 [Podospora comata]